MRLEQMNELSIQAYRAARELSGAIDLLIAQGDDQRARGKAIAIISRVVGRADVLAEQLDMPGVRASGVNVVRFPQE